MDLVCGTVFLMNWDHLTLLWLPSETNWRRSVTVLFSAYLYFRITLMLIHDTPQNNITEHTFATHRLFLPPSCRQALCRCSEHFQRFICFIISASISMALLYSWHFDSFQISYILDINGKSNVKYQNYLPSSWYEIFSVGIVDYIWILPFITSHICIMSFCLCCILRITGAVVPSTISSHCCSIPFTLNGNLYYSCTNDGSGVGCFYGDREWKLCRQPAG